MDHIGDEDLREIIQILISISAGDLREVLKDIDLDRDGIHDLAGLFHHLIGEAASHDYTEEDVIRLFLNLLKILENRSLADELSDTLTEEEADSGGGSYWYLWVLGGLLLILLAIILVRRRRQSGGTEGSV
jgi:MYXO-CTERM domain-containing protein